RSRSKRETVPESGAVLQIGCGGGESGAVRAPFQTEERLKAKGPAVWLSPCFFLSLLYLTEYQIRHNSPALFFKCGKRWK
ncbi:MAG TPA: hypothetical protein VGN01_16525, partial [Acidobacteriaceae bacterium]